MRNIISVPALPSLYDDGRQISFQPASDHEIAVRVDDDDPMYFHAPDLLTAVSEAVALELVYGPNLPDAAPDDARTAQAHVDLRNLQDQVGAWVEHNFGHDNELATVIGLVEEVGEISRAVVKRSQGIRGSRQEWDAELRKEAADVLIKLCDVASFYSFDLADAVAKRWAEVRQRDWKADPNGHGLPELDPAEEVR